MFSQVTNQMVKACKAYITDDGMTRIWDQTCTAVTTRMRHCILLYDHYQLAFQNAKKKMAQNPDEKPFDFSEMYIFGKFDAFCKRLDKVCTNLHIHLVLQTFILLR